MSGIGERTVKKLRLFRALTVAEGTTVSVACRRMAARRVDAVLLTDANGLLSGIATDKDIATRVVAKDLRPEQTILSKVMTRNPKFVMSDTLVTEALQMMVQGKLRHLPVVEAGEVIAMLNITNCLRDTLLIMEKTVKQGSSTATEVEGVNPQSGNNINDFMKMLKEHFRNSLSTIIQKSSRVPTVLPSDPVPLAAKRMREYRADSVLVMTGNKIQGILTSKDILMHVVAKNLCPELTVVEKVMRTNPECVKLETTIFAALHIMHNLQVFHLPVVDKDGRVAASVDILQLTHAATSVVENRHDVASTVIQKSRYSIDDSHRSGVGERTLEKLRLSEALIVHEETSLLEACRRMVVRHVDAVLLTDANGLLSGIVTDQDITTRVVAEDLMPKQTTISKVMTRNPYFVMSDCLAIETLSKMVQGKFRHLPVVENGEVTSILDIKKCLYDVLQIMVNIAEQGCGTAEIDEDGSQTGSKVTASTETLGRNIYSPISTIILENSRFAIVTPSDPVRVAAKRMRELCCNSVLVITGNKIQGILTSKDVLTRVVAQDLCPDLTLVEKVMTANPECANLELTILEALHIMHEQKLSHLPVVDKDGCVAACVDILQITGAIISMFKR